MSSKAPLLHTPLFSLHQELGGKIVPFAGYAMPVQYADGIMKEHLHTRAAAGLFDVSHMGQIKVVGDNLASVLEAIFPADLINLAVGEQKYTLLLNDKAGICDDLIVSRFQDHFILVVNAATKHDDFGMLRCLLPSDVELTLLDDLALLALQGPKARDVLTTIFPEAGALTFMQAAYGEWQGNEVRISCSGYTGEDGFEIALPAEHAEAFAKLLLDDDRVKAIGLGARDSLRLEAALCLYGQDITESVTPIEASLSWAISAERKPGGVRAGSYPGSDVIADQLENKPLQQRILLQPEGKLPVRAGADLVTEDGEVVGKVTSGGFGPSVSAPVAMGYVNRDSVQSKQSLFALVRKNKVPMQVVKQSFVPSRYYRG